MEIHTAAAHMTGWQSPRLCWKLLAVRLQPEMRVEWGCRANLSGEDLKFCIIWLNTAWTASHTSGVTTFSNVWHTDAAGCYWQTGISCTKLIPRNKNTFFESSFRMLSSLNLLRQLDQLGKPLQNQPCCLFFFSVTCLAGGVTWQPDCHKLHGSMNYCRAAKPVARILPSSVFAGTTQGRIGCFGLLS